MSDAEPQGVPHGEKLAVEKPINISLLKPGDIVGMKYDNGDGIGELMFNVESSEISHAGVNVGGPKFNILGNFRGFLPAELANKKFYLGGRKVGAATQFGLISNGHRINFMSSDGNTYLSPEVNSLEIYRKDETGSMQPISTESLSSESKEIATKQESRISKIKDLINKLGFKEDFENCQSSSSGVGEKYEDGRFVIGYRQGMALGNLLAIYDKSSGRWSSFGYFNFSGENALKVSFSDLKGLDPKEIFITGIGFETGILHTDRSITTFNTSPNMGIDIINYRPGVKDLGDIGIEDYDPKKYRYRGKPSLNIILYSDGRSSIDANGFFTPIEESHPGALGKINSALSLNKDQKFSFNGHDVVAIDPDKELDELLIYFSKT